MDPAGYQTYQRIQAETSSPAQLVMQLYDALMRDLQRASQQMTTTEGAEQAHTALVHAQDVVLELAASLDLSTGDLAQNLADLYQYMYRRLVHANVQKDRSVVDEVVRLLLPIHQAWAVAVQAAPTNQPATSRTYAG